MQSCVNDVIKSKKMDGKAKGKGEELQHLLSEEQGKGSEDEGSHPPPQPPVYEGATEQDQSRKNARSSSPPPSYVYAQQQKVVRRPLQGNPPGDQFLMSLFTIFCCFMPLGVVALIKSVEARQAYQSGRLEHAVAATRTAKTFNKLSIMINLVLLCFLIVMYTLLFYFFASLGAQYSSEN